MIDDLGRWSMVDLFTIACFAPIMQFSSLIDGRAGLAATPFAAVVILTTLAASSFDPRVMWDRAGFTACVPSTSPSLCRRPAAARRYLPV